RAIFARFSTEVVEAGLQPHVRDCYDFAPARLRRSMTFCFCIPRRLIKQFARVSSVHSLERPHEGCRLLSFLLVPLADQLESFLQNWTWAGAVGFANQAFALHLIEHGSGTAIADAQA